MVSYPTAPIDKKARKAFFQERNRRIQAHGVRPADGVTFAKAAKQKRDD